MQVVEEPYSQISGHVGPGYVYGMPSGTSHIETQQVIIGQGSKSYTHFICVLSVTAFLPIHQQAAIKYPLTFDPLGVVTLTFEPKCIFGLPGRLWKQYCNIYWYS